MAAWQHGSMALQGLFARDRLCKCTVRSDLGLETAAGDFGLENYRLKHFQRKYLRMWGLMHFYSKQVKISGYCLFNEKHNTLPD
jgi:hypothetical protein